ncbi:hypothetical protein [Qipengyuania sp. JC766]|uniref:hypothetical protein n=1 Tax=Qipengyuania sp. JC766 TaxID=3232139 RepID=UPI00345AFFC8
MERIALALALVGFAGVATYAAQPDIFAGANVAGVPDPVIDQSPDEVKRRLDDLSLELFLRETFPQVTQERDGTIFYRTYPVGETRYRAEYGFLEDTVVTIEVAIEPVGPERTRLVVEADVPANWLAMQPGMQDGDQATLAALADAMATEWILAKLENRPVARRFEDLPASWKSQIPSTRAETDRLLDRTAEAVLAQYGEQAEEDRRSEQTWNGEHAQAADMAEDAARAAEEAATSDFLETDDQSDWGD